ncbi:unnamed protein product [Periconia digitata]|uniref:Uncharacterized protein n=1 Tax=Periconia digitata TaxID=1303443 RepID=A0A9W4XM32_9PLEO|nr:unnamed protein product [Periconia digitata]
MPSQRSNRGAPRRPAHHTTFSDSSSGNPFSSPMDHESEDIAIPAHLLQASSAVGTNRTDGHVQNWQPQRQLSVRDQRLPRAAPRRNVPVLQRPPAVKRSSTLPSRSSSPDPKESSRSATLDALTRVATEGAVQNGEHNSNGPTGNATKRTRRVSFLDEPKHALHNETRRSWRSSIMSDYSEPEKDTSHRSWRFSPPAAEDGPSVTSPDRKSWRLSYTPGDSERLTTSPKSPGAQFPRYRPESQDFPEKTPSSDPFADPLVSDGQNPISQPDRSASRGKRPRRGTLDAVVNAIVPESLQRKMTNRQPNGGLARSSSMRKTFEKAKERGQQLQRKKWVQIVFEYGIYLFLLCFIYFVLIGIPLWNGAVWWMYWVVANKFVFAGGFSITLGIALFYAFAPLLIVFENDPPAQEMTTETKIQPNVQDTALLIPCYKSANLIAATLEAALKIFPPSHIFVLANGNSPTPLDNTEEICRPYGVTHLWSPVGSKIVAQFVGCYAAKRFKNVLLIDDDCALPENFPVVTDRLVGNVKCIGYTIKSVGPNSSKGNFCQQAQDLEYKLSGLQREFAGKIGSATFPHGAIALWDRELLVKTFYQHPGFSVSEDWFFGHAARQLGCRITMCSQVFVETETPTAVFISGGGSRGGFGEMTIFSQRFKRWNFFFVNGMWYNMAYIFCNWKLGWWEIGAKLFVFQEVYETLLYLLTPFILPISFYVRPSFCGILLGATVVMYLVNTIIFNEVHLRRKNERIGWTVVLVYYLPYKIVLTFINVASCYWSLYKYARYFAKRHPKVIEDEKAVEVVVRLEEGESGPGCGLGRKLTVKTVAATSDSDKDSEMQDMSPPPTVGLAFEPEPVNSGMSTPTRQAEGISAYEFNDPRHLQVNKPLRHGNSTQSSTDSLVSSNEMSARPLL